MFRRVGTYWHLPRAGAGPSRDLEWNRPRRPGLKASADGMIGDLFGTPRVPGPPDADRLGGGQGGLLAAASGLQAFSTPDRWAPRRSASCTIV